MLPENKQLRLREKKMTKICEVCHNMASRTDRELVGDPLERVTYHRIPTNRERNKIWLAFCGLSRQDNTNNKLVNNCFFLN